MTDHDSGLGNWLDGIDLSQNAPDEESVLTDGEVDIKALLLRRFTWDTMKCSHVAELLPKLGLTVGDEEGVDHEHAESHQRMAAVMPFEAMLQEYAIITSTILSTAITEAYGVTDQMDPEDAIGYVRQNAELILSGGRAMMAQLFWMGLLTYGPSVQIHTGHLDEHGNVVLDDEVPDMEGPPSDELPDQISFDDLERGSE